MSHAHATERRATGERFELVVFDLDGTLIDSSKDIHRAVNLALAELELPTRTLAEVHDYLGDGARSLIAQALPESARHRVDEALACYRAHYIANLVVDTKAYDGIDALVRDYQGLSAIATNKSEALAVPIVKALGWGDVFASVIGGDSLPAAKPDRVVLETICQRLSVSPSQTLMVGDGPQDILAAKNAGVRSCAVTWGYKPSEALACAPDFVAESVTDLRRLLAR